MTVAPWVIGTRPAAPLALGLGAELEEVPQVTLDGAWSAGSAVEKWRNALIGGPEVEGVVVAVWAESPEPSMVADQELDRWMATMETPFALWFAALAAGSARCADGGQLVAVVDRTDPKDAAGWGSVTALAEAVKVMTRSLALAHEDRGVRVNLVTSPARLTRPGNGSPDGSMDEMVETVSMLLSNPGREVTATVINLGGDL
jgi:NAD(P)-dependent dehydrogenase (short-subunit alcohol dehydrogenase family)